jgi:uncharacterized repeat protein (TIGR01451 family)
LIHIVVGMKQVLTATLFTMLFAVTASAQLAPTITKSFNPSVVSLNGNSDATITVTNPNAFPISNVQFSDTMPAGVDLITQLLRNSAVRAARWRPAVGCSRSTLAPRPSPAPRVF